MSDSCANCRHHSTVKRPKVIGETGFGDQLMFSDEDETVFICMKGSRSSVLAINDVPSPFEVGTTPLARESCTSWEAPAARAAREAELDAMMDAMMARHAARGEK